MKIVTWNVNSLRVRLGQLSDWVQLEMPDILCLQETKVEDGAFPKEILLEMGYHSAFSGQKTYNGVAILSRWPIEDVRTDLAGYADDQKRFIAATINHVRVVNLYVPNGSEVGCEKYRYKLTWLENMRLLLEQELRSYPSLVVVGDFNIAPTDADVYDPIAWGGKVLCSKPERDAYQLILDLGLHDSLRRFSTGSDSYTWWDYRTNAFRRGQGLRIDHILVSSALAPLCAGCHVERSLRALERPSDHAPVVIEVSV